MHELSLAQGLVGQLESVARAEEAVRVVRVVVAVGPYAGVDAKALAFAFPFAAEGTLAEGASLEIRELPARVDCAACGAVSSPDPLWLRCVHCGSDEVRIDGGRELQIVEAELELAQ